MTQFSKKGCDGSLGGSMHKTQRGVTFIGWLFLLIPMAVVGYSAIRLVPVYLNYTKIARTMEQLSQESSADESQQSIRTAIEKRLDIEGISFPETKDFIIRREGQAWVVQIQYEDGAPLLSNVSIVAKFDKSVRLGRSTE
jgi:hypothetical protein